MSDSKSAAAPFLKYAGGKRQLLSEILPLLPKKMGSYYEPFVGGGAVFFALANEGRFERAHLSDVHGPLVDAYNVVKRDLPALVETLQRHKNKFFNAAERSHYYYAERAKYQEGECACARAANMIFLNKTCFNGLHRVNSSGKFNVPFGDYKNPTILDEPGLAAVSKALSRASISCADFEDVVAGKIAPAGPGDVVYFDPPYVPTSMTSNFVAYSKEGFTFKDQARLRDVALALKKRGVFVLLSNSGADMVRDLYKAPDFTIREVAAKRVINSKVAGRGNVVELLIT